MKTLVILPTYNEKASIESLVGSILSIPANLHILIVDDCSPDGTGEIADRIAAQHQRRVFVMHRAGKLGLGTAYLDGFRFGLAEGFEALCEMDADGSHDPGQLLDLITVIQQGTVHGEFQAGE